MAALAARPAAAADLSDYRQNTYGPPTRYCDPTRLLTSAGTGALADPWNMQQCADLPVAGNIVGILPGVSVALPTTNSSRIPAFNPRNSGTAGSRIIYVTKFAAVLLPSVESNANRTEFRHNGGAPYITGGVGAGNGAPMIGAYQRSYITFDGFYIDMARAYMREDSGVLRAEDSVGVHFKNFVVKGATLTVASNAVIYRPNNARDTVLSNFRAYNFVNNPTGSATPQPALFSDQYGDQNVLIEHFEIRGIHFGIYFKGTANSATVFNYGTVRYGIVSGAASCFRFNDLDFNNLTTVEYNLCYDVSGEAGLSLSSETSPARNILIHHNTIARVDSANINTQGAFYTRARGISGTNVTIRDNVVDINSGSYGHMVGLAETTVLPNVLNFNGYTKNGATLTWAFNNAQFNSISAWRTATARDMNSSVFSTTPFMNRSSADFRIAAGHAAKTASSTGGELGAFAGPRLPGVDVSGLPPAPTGLRIQP
jgi:hypothetical protein